MAAMADGGRPFRQREDGDPGGQIGPEFKRALRVKVGRGSRVDSHNVLNIKLTREEKN